MYWKEACIHAYMLSMPERAILSALKRRNRCRFFLNPTDNNKLIGAVFCFVLPKGRGHQELGKAEGLKDCLLLLKNACKSLSRAYSDK